MRDVREIMKFYLPLPHPPPAYEQAQVGSKGASARFSGWTLPIFHRKVCLGRFSDSIIIYWVLFNSIGIKLLETRQGIVSLSFDILSKVRGVFGHQK